MIARLKGIVEALDTDTAILDVQGVGYLVACPSRTLSKMAVGQPAALWIETVVREDAISLYGFMDATEKAWFKKLTTVQGVGAKVGLALLTVLPPDALARAIAAGDKAAIGRANGVGPKLAQRILTELKDKVADLAGIGVTMAPTVSVPVAVSSAKSAVPADVDPRIAITNDAVSALANLGYGQSDAFAVVSSILAAAGDDVPTVEAVLAKALKDMAMASGLVTGGKS